MLNVPRKLKLAASIAVMSASLVLFQNFIDVDLFSRQIMNNNRKYATAMGGWGPHLRGIMRTSTNSLWFVSDQGPSVESNTSINYYKQQTDGSWSLAGSQNHLAGVQQNTANILLGGRFIYTYGLAVYGTPPWIEECYFDTTNVNYKACNAVVISGAPYELPANSNYVGAAVHPNGTTRVVYWTTVNNNVGGTGTFSYIYNYGGGWNGPVTYNVPSGFNDFSYVAGTLRDNKFVGVGQLVKKTSASPAAFTFQASAVSMTLGQAPKYVTLNLAGDTVKTGSDVYLDPSGAAHILAETSGSKVAYFYQPTTPFPTGLNSLAAVSSESGVFRGRFVKSDHLHMIVGSNSTNNIKVFSSEMPTNAQIDWSQATLTETNIPVTDFGAPNALYVEGAQYQSTAVQGLNFAVCGSSTTGKDNLIWHVNGIMNLIKGDCTTNDSIRGQNVTTQQTQSQCQSTCDAFYSSADSTATVSDCTWLPSGGSLTTLRGGRAPIVKGTCETKDTARGLTQTTDQTYAQCQTACDAFYSSAAGTSTVYDCRYIPNSCGSEMIVKTGRGPQ